MRHLMISAIYALACLASFILAVTVSNEGKAGSSIEKIIEIEEAKINKNKDNASQTLTTYYPEPTEIAKNL